MEKKQVEAEKSLLEKAFTEIMPEVKFVDVISKNNFKNQKFLKSGKKK